MGPIIVLPHRDETTTPMPVEAQAALRADVEADLAGDVDDPTGHGCALAMGCGMTLALVGSVAFLVAWWLR